MSMLKPISEVLVGREPWQVTATLLEQLALRPRPWGGCENSASSVAVLLYSKEGLTSWHVIALQGSTGQDVWNPRLPASSVIWDRPMNMVVSLTRSRTVLYVYWGRGRKELRGGGSPLCGWMAEVDTDDRVSQMEWKDVGLVMHISTAFYMMLFSHCGSLLPAAKPSSQVKESSFSFFSHSQIWEWGHLTNTSWLTSCCLVRLAITTSREIWIPGKFDFPEKLTYQECWLTGKVDLPGKLTYWENWLTGKIEFPRN